MRKNVWTWAVAAALAVALLLFTICFTVQAGTVGAVYTLGALSPEAVRVKPDLYWKMPWPLQAERIVDIRMRLLPVLEGETPTRDEFNVNVGLAVGWKVRETPESVVQYLSTFPAGDAAAEATLRIRVADARGRLIKETRLDDIINTSPKQTENYAAFERKILDLVQKDLDNAHYGIEIAFLRIQSITLPKDNTQKVFDRMIKERERVSRDLIAQGKDRAAQIKNNAQLERSLKLSEATGKAIRIRGEGDAQAAEHYKVFKENPELASFLRRLDALTAILKERTTIVLPADRPLDALLEEPPVLPAAPKAEKGN